MSIKQKLKRILIWGSVATFGCGIAYLGYKNLPKPDNLQYLPTESILKKEVQQNIETNINNALFNIMDKSDFELAVHVNLNQDEITEELIKYEPKEISTLSLIHI